MVPTKGHQKLQGLQQAENVHDDDSIGDKIMIEQSKKNPANLGKGINRILKSCFGAFCDRYSSSSSPIFLKNDDVIYEQPLNAMSVEVLETLGKLSTNQVSKVEVQSLH